YSWSSPVAIYTKEGKSYLILSDSGGYMNLFEGATGKKLDSLPLEANVEGSPAVYDDMIVVGTRGSKIWGIRIK
ncbi:MAG: pyrrolo-quinoline quinone, partial [Ruminiclostridium sp.]|nr:pyrrolo-quinoline quinone [Ruminiclostridium sp.]